VTTTIGNYVPIFARELGVVALILAAFGLLVSLRHRRTAATYPLLIAFLGNLLGAAAVVGPGSSGGFDGDLSQEGFILGCYFVLACWLAIGATQLVQSAGGISLGRRLNLGARRRFVEALMAVVLAVVLLVPAVISHWSVVRRDVKPFADSYATSVFNELPPRSVVVILGFERATPLIYRQVVYHQRRDVVVVAADGLNHDWYREQLTRRLGQPLPPAVANDVLNARRVVKSLSGVRPVYLDDYTAQLLGGQFAVGRGAGDTIGYQPVGILAKLVGGSGAAPVSSPAVLDQTVRDSERAAGMPDPNWLAWPNDYVATSVYLNAGLEVVRAYYKHGDAAGMRAALLQQLSIDPNDGPAQTDLSKLNQAQGSG
jgi:hypothetical protein